MKHIYRIVCITTALAIACIFITPAIADDSAQKAKELFSRGIEASKAQKYEEAIKYFEAVLGINPDNAEAHNNLGLAYMRLSRRAEAAEAFRRAIRINPDHADAHYNMGFAYRKLGRYNEARAVYKKAIRINPGYAEAHYNMGVAYVTSGNREAALAEYEIIKGLDSDLANKLFSVIYK